MNRENENLTLLGGGKTEYRSDYAPEVLETFENKHRDNDYWVRFNCPEFTSLCPITSCICSASGTTAIFTRTA